jgi:signal transduction histidine kinase
MDQKAMATVAQGHPDGNVPSWAWICGSQILRRGYSDRYFDQEIPNLLKLVCAVGELGLRSRAALYLTNGAENPLILAGQLNVDWNFLDRSISQPTEAITVDGSGSKLQLRLATEDGLESLGAVTLFPAPKWQLTEERTEGLQHIAFQLAAVLKARKLNSERDANLSPAGEMASHVKKSADARKLLKITIDNFPGGICVLDGKLTMIVTNSRFYELLDLPAHQFPVGSNFEDVFRFNATRGEYGPGDIDQIVDDRLSHVRLFLEHSFDRETGGGLVVEARTAPMPGGGCVLTYLDVTAKRRAEQALLKNKETLELLVKMRTEEIEQKAQELRRMLDQERQINEMQRQFVTMTSHEFRTPLAIIDGAAQRLIRQRGQLTPEYISEKSALIRSAAGRMVDLMESFLSAGRLENGKMSFEFRPCSLKDIILRCCSRQQTIAKGHLIHHDLDGLPETTGADIAALEQVFTNLLSNAVKYAPNSPDIFVHGGTDTRSAWITVHDQGVGIDSEDIPLMFQRYFRARTSTGIAGTGIGLNLVKQIVEYHGGTVSVVSRKGEGTTFTVKLPLERMLANVAQQ